MRILSIETNGCRGVADRRYDLASSAEGSNSLMALTGPSGAGKTSLLDAIAAGKELVAPYGTSPASSDLIREDLDECKISMDWSLTEDERSFAALEGPASSEVIVRRRALVDVDADAGLIAVLERYSHYAGYGKMDYFPDDRAVPTHAVLLSDLVMDQRMQRLARGPGKYAGIARMTREVLLDEDAGRLGTTLKELFSHLCPTRRLVGVGPQGAPVFESTVGSKQTLEKLPASEKMAFLFAAGFVLLGLHDSVVLIDTPELRMGPGDAARILSELMSFAPTTQLVVATRDPSVLELAGAANTLKLEPS